MLIYSFEEFKSVLEFNPRINDYNSYIQWEYDIVPDNSPFKNFVNKEGNTHIRHIALILPSKGIVVLVWLGKILDNRNSNDSNTVRFNNIVEKIKGHVKTFLSLDIEYKLELICELYRAQTEVMKLLTTEKILVLEKCLDSSREDSRIYSQMLRESRESKDRLVAYLTITQDCENSAKVSTTCTNTAKDVIGEYTEKLDTQSKDYLKQLDKKSKNYSELFEKQKTMYTQTINEQSERFESLLRDYRQLGRRFQALEDAYYGHKHFDQSLGTVKSMLSIGSTLAKIL